MKTFFKSCLLSFFALATAGSSNAQSTLGAACGCPTPVSGRTVVNFSTLADAAGNLTAKNTVLSCDKTYVLDNTGANTTGKFFVGEGKTLTIAPGTVIKGMAQSTAGAFNGGGLIVSRGAKIIAAGTESCPIVFTAFADPMTETAGAPTYGINNRGKWGGVILLGTATNNLAAGNIGAGTSFLGVAGLIGVGRIEGFTSPEPRIYFGASATETNPAFQAYDDNDNSGIMTYVSIRHGGEVVGTANEVNGLTLGSVGRGTTLHHIEVVSNQDDGIEFFGGTVDLKYASVLFSDDDAFDWDLGWSGRGQFWVNVKTDQGTSSGGDNGFELDGDDNKVGTGIMSNPNVYNATYVGSLGINGNGVAKGVGIEMKEETNGTIRNSVIANFGLGARFVDDATRPGGEDAADNWLAGTLKVECNTFAGVTTPLTVSGAAVTDVTNSNYIKFFTTDKNSLATPAGFDFTHAMNTTTNAVTETMDMVPSALALGTGCNAAPADGFFSPATYRGAFEPGKKSWLSNYSYNALLDIENALVPCDSDINKDGATNVNDLLLLLPQFNKNCD